jgi:hypothetical protein
MNLRILSSGSLSALAGAAMLTLSADPSPAFTLYSPSLEAPVAAAGVQQVWYDRWGHWHPNYYHRPYYRPYYYHRYYPPYYYHPYYRPYYYHPYYHRYRHCWRNAYGVYRCYWR